MTNLLPIGTVVRLHNGTIGYFWLCKIDEDSWENKRWKRTIWGWCESARSLSKTLWMAFDYLYDKYGDKVVEFAGDVWDGTKKVVGDTMKSVGDAADKI